MERSLRGRHRHGRNYPLLLDRLFLCPTS
jgi:hypothetical protein